ncbi:hypothetical protein ACLOJK_008237 [Asimina triloba]
MEEERKVAALRAASRQRWRRSTRVDVVGGSGRSSGIANGGMVGSTGMTDTRWTDWITRSRGLPATIMKQMASSESTAGWAQNKNIRSYLAVDPYLDRNQ